MKIGWWIVVGGPWLVVCGLWCVGTEANAQNYRMMKDSTTHGDSIAYGESMTGFFAVGQSVSSQVAGTSQQGWLGFLPVIRSLKPLSVFENTGDGHLTLAPNPATDQLTIKGVFDLVIDVQAWSVIGSPLRVPFQQADDGIVLDVGSLASGSYRIVVECETGRYSRAVIIAR